MDTQSLGASTLSPAGIHPAHAGKEDPDWPKTTKRKRKKWSQSNSAFPVALSGLEFACGISWAVVLNLPGHVQAYLWLWELAGLLDQKPSPYPHE